MKALYRQTIPNVVKIEIKFFKEMKNIDKDEFI